MVMFRTHPNTNRGVSKNAIAFTDREKAYAFDAYLKLHCGRAFTPIFL